MIKNHWYAVLESSYVKRGKVHSVKRFGENLALWRSQDGTLNCFEDRCAHRGTALSLGTVEGNCIQCPYHGFKYDSSGFCTLIPANGKKARVPRIQVKKYIVREVHGLIWLWWGSAENKSLPEIPWFEGFSGQSPSLYTQISRETPVSFSRLMEANLDFGHFYFVHKFFRIPGLGPVALPFRCEVDGNLIEVSGVFRQDLAQENEGVEIYGAVLFPALATYYTPGKEGKDRAIIAVCPVDDRKSWFMIRIYVMPGPLAFLRKLSAILFTRLIFPILHKQDLRVMERQQPMHSGVADDRLVARADLGIAKYFELWRRSAGETALEHSTESEKFFEKGNIPESVKGSSEISTQLQ